MTVLGPILDLEDAELAYQRVREELEAVRLDQLTPQNVDLLQATSIAIGAAPNILAHREELATLPKFDMRCVDNLLDYAKAAWFACVMNLPQSEPDDTKLMSEVLELRGTLLKWAVPLIDAGKFDHAAIAKIKQGAGKKDKASDLMALVSLYRAKWHELKNMCGVSEQDLERGGMIGMALFTQVSRREQRLSSALSDRTLRMRRAWTLLDDAYFECRRGLTYLRARIGDADELAPSMRKNAGRRPGSKQARGAETLGDKKPTSTDRDDPDEND